MITEEKIAQNRDTFISLIKNVQREGFDTDYLIRQLDGSDFWVAPASTKYHSCFAGGLVEHCLEVYYALCKLITMQYPNGSPYSNDTITIVALLHDFAKMNFYEKSVQNKKVYSDTGSKRDEMGRFDWISVPGYKVKESTDRFIFGTHEQTCLYMAETFVPLTTEEAAAILHHMGFTSTSTDTNTISLAMQKYPLALLLHCADMIATYLNETCE